MVRWLIRWVKKGEIKQNFEKSIVLFGILIVSQMCAAEKHLDQDNPFYSPLQQLSAQLATCLEINQSLNQMTVEEQRAFAFNFYKDNQGLWNTDDHLVQRLPYKGFFTKMKISLDAQYLATFSLGNMLTIFKISQSLCEKFEMCIQRYIPGVVDFDFFDGQELWIAKKNGLQRVTFSLEDVSRSEASDEDCENSGFFWECIPGDAITSITHVSQRQGMSVITQFWPLIFENSRSEPIKFQICPTHGKCQKFFFDERQSLWIVFTALGKLLLYPVGEKIAVKSIEKKIHLSGLDSEILFDAENSTIFSMAAGSDVKGHTVLDKEGSLELREIRMSRRSTASAEFITLKKDDERKRICIGNKDGRISIVTFDADYIFRAISTFSVPPRGKIAWMSEDGSLLHIFYNDGKVVSINLYPNILQIQNEGALCSYARRGLSVFERMLREKQEIVQDRYDEAAQRSQKANLGSSQWPPALEDQLPPVRAQRPISRLRPSC